MFSSLSAIVSFREYIRTSVLALWNLSHNLEWILCFSSIYISSSNVILSGKIHMTFEKCFDHLRVTIQSDKWIFWMYVRVILFFTGWYFLLITFHTITFYDAFAAFLVFILEPNQVISWLCSSRTKLTLFQDYVKFCFGLPWFWLLQYSIGTVRIMFGTAANLIIERHIITRWMQ